MEDKKKFSSAFTICILGLSSSIALADRAECTVSTDGITNTCSGIYAVYDQSHLNYENVVINNTASSYTMANGVQGTGIYVSSMLSAENLTVTTNGSNFPFMGGTDAIRTNGNSSLTVTGKLVVSANGYSADAINASITSSATVNTGNNSEIFAAHGVAVRANLSQGEGGGNLINIGNNAYIETKGDGRNEYDSLGYAVYAGNRTNEAVAIPKGTAKVVIGDDAKIQTKGESAYAVYANKTGYIQLGNNVDIKTTGIDAHGIVAEDGLIKSNGAEQHYAGGRVDLLGDTTIIVQGAGAKAIYANGAGSVISSYNIDANAQTSGKFNVTGDMQAVNGGVIDLRMTNGSKFTGATSFTGNDSVLSLDIAGASSKWEITKSSQLTDLVLSDNANVIFGDQTTLINSSNQIVLTTNNLSGNGHFQMRTDVIGTGLGANNIGDLLKVTGTSSGNHLITVFDQYNGSAIVDGSERLILVETSDGGAQFKLNNPGDYVDVGAYKYYLNKGDTQFAENANDWYLSATNSTGGDNALTNSADHSANILNINYLLNYAETQTLLHRMGELHQPREKEWDFWMRGFAGKMSSFSGKLSGFEMDYHGFQAGLDRYFEVDGNDLYAGVMFGTSKAKADYDVGNGDTKSYHVGFYGTYKTQSDLYIDAIAKYTMMKNDFNTQTGGGYQVNGDGKTRGYTFGLETGKRFYFDRKVKAGWYVEPQAQLTYSHQGSATIHSSNGLKTKLDKFDSVLGRASTVIGYNLSQGKTPVDVYLKTGYVKEFDGKTGYSFNGNENARHKYQFDGSWWDNGVGVNVNVNQEHNFYAEADYAKGTKFNNKSIKVGYRLDF